MTETAGDVSDFGDYEWKMFPGGLKKFFKLSTSLHSVHNLHFASDLFFLQATQSLNPESFSHNSLKYV